MFYHYFKKLFHFVLSYFQAHMKITGIMQKSNEIARSMAQLMKVSQLQSVSSQFTKELIKVG